MTNIPKSSFTRAFVRLNGLDVLGFVRWIFMPGTDFGARDKWWAPTEIRSSPHEGFDICSFKGRVRQS